MFAGPIMKMEYSMDWRAQRCLEEIFPEMEFENDFYSKQCNGKAYFSYINWFYNNWSWLVLRWHNIANT